MKKIIFLLLITMHLECKKTPDTIIARFILEIIRCKDLDREKKLGLLQKLKDKNPAFCLEKRYFFEKKNKKNCHTVLQKMDDLFLLEGEAFPDTDKKRIKDFLEQWKNEVIEKKIESYTKGDPLLCLQIKLYHLYKQDPDCDLKMLSLCRKNRESLKHLNLNVLFRFRSGELEGICPAYPRYMRGFRMYMEKLIEQVLRESLSPEEEIAFDKITPLPEILINSFSLEDCVIVDDIKEVNPKKRSCPFSQVNIDPTLINNFLATSTVQVPKRIQLLQ